MVLSAPVLALPLVDLLPLQAPRAVQELALVEDQVKVLLEPSETLPGEALRDVVGGVGGGGKGGGT